MSNLLKQLSLRNIEINAASIDASMESSFLGLMSSEDIQYTTEARFNDAIRALNFCESFEAITARYSAMDLSVESMADYHFTVGVLMDSTGVSAPLESFTVSLEAAEADKKSFGQKAKGVIEAVLKWLREMMGKLKDWLTKSKVNASKNTEQIKKKADAAKETIKEVKATGVTAVPPKAEEPKTPASVPAAAPAAKAADNTPAKTEPVKEGKVERDTVRDGAKRRPSTPAYLLKSGKLDTPKIRKFLVAVSDINYKALFESAMKEAESGGEDFDTFTKAWREIFDDFHSPVGSAQLDVEGADLSELSSLLDLVKSDADYLLILAQDTQFALGKLEKAEMELKQSNTDDPEKIAKDRKYLGKLLAVSRDGQSFHNNLYTAVNSLVNELTKIANMAKHPVQA